MDTETTPRKVLDTINATLTLDCVDQHSFNLLID